MTSESASHPSELTAVQATFRFIVELAVLAGWGAVGWQLSEGGERWLWMFALPLAAISLWGTFRVPGDRSAGKDGALAVPGPVRLAIELVVLLGAAIALAIAGSPIAGGILALAIVVHGVTTPRRLRWLVGARAHSR